MQNKIKEIFSAALIMAVILLLGLAPGSNQKNSSFTVYWGDLGARMIAAGVIDAEKFEEIYAQRGGLSPSDKQLLYGTKNNNLKITKENSGVVLNMLWAFGLANKNPILTEGSMMTYGSAGSPAEAEALAGNLASTGGWTLAKGDAMSHYGMHEFAILTPEQQVLVEKVAKNIYRPCCGNSTFFPDCNHGMAMLGLLEIMAAQGATEEEMYQVALEVNTFWFPDTYVAIKSLFDSRGVDWYTVDPKEILGAEYSSASGYQKVLSQIKPQNQNGGPSCGA